MRTRLSKHKTFEDVLQNLFFCPACSTWRRPFRKPPSTSLARRASTLSSSTAINSSSAIPTESQALYSALTDVRRSASPFVSLSRLQLALQGLQSVSHKIRIAVLGLNVQDTARRLVRLLLADALEQEAAWEKELASIQGDQGILVTYGQAQNSSLPQARTTVPTLHVPSTLLERSNVEILISVTTPPQNGGRKQDIPSETLLSPTVNTPSGAGGRHTLISQPVHASLLVAQGFDELLNIAELVSAVRFASNDESESVTIGVDLSDSKTRTTGSTLILDLSKAERGLQAVRKSISDTPAYAKDWSASGMLQVLELFTDVSYRPGNDYLSESLRRLVSSILAAAATSIDDEVTSQLASQTSSLSLAARTNLDLAIEEFTRNAHQELQSGLASAWSSHNWRKLAWYKLFWRVDDVGLITTDLISNAWLPRTERAVYELSGRLAQVGISPMDAMPAETVPQPAANLEQLTEPGPITSVQAQFATAADAPIKPVFTNVAGTAAVQMTPVPAPQPLSTTISSMRSTTSSRAIADLTSTAQQLVLRTLSITGMSAGLSGLTYMSFASSVYEAGTILALGTAFALYRMQGGWMRATKALEEGLFDEGRSVIQRVVGRMRQLVVNAAEEKDDDVELRRLKEAKESVERAQMELQKLSKPKTYEGK